MVSMKRIKIYTLILGYLVGFGILSLHAAEDPFPPFSSLKEPVRMPRNPELTIDRDGTVLINRVPRYLISTLYYEEVPATLSRHTAGYPAELN